jgi:hypothetical protein
MVRCHSVATIALLALPAFGTSIVSWTVENKSIVLAADSVIVGTSKTTGGSERTSSCKIRCIERACFSATGRYSNETIGYDLFGMAMIELQRRETPQTTAGLLKALYCVFCLAFLRFPNWKPQVAISVG